MEITIKDLQKLKLPPSLIVLLKAIINKDDVYLQELNKVASVKDMTKYLEKNLFIKIISNKIECDSFEIRKLSIVNYLNEANKKGVEEAKLIFDHFVKVKEKYTQKKDQTKFNTHKDWLTMRVKRGVDFEDAIKIIDMKFVQWFNTSFQIHLNFQTMLGPNHYLKNVQQLGLSVETKPTTMNINKMI